MSVAADSPAPVPTASPSRGGRRSILVVEDDADIAELVRFNLVEHGLADVVVVNDGEQAISALRQRLPALVLLDILLPGMTGLELCRRLRNDAVTAALPIIMLTAKAAEVDRVLGLEMGADDYITKPFSPRELVARVGAVLRRTSAPPPDHCPDAYEKGRLRIDFDNYEVCLDGTTLELTRREFELLRFFVRSPNRVYDRLQILDLVWGQETYVEPRTVDVHVRRLRARIERDDAKPELIQTVRGVGYKFDERALEP
jgi:two-component system alkaline phosphatase synthesis response regulator PhoP